MPKNKAMPSVMKHQFSQVPRAEIQRSRFDRSHGRKTTFDAGYLVPVFLDEVLPGDTFNLRMTAFARLNTPIVPIMDNLYLDTFFFAVPYRLVWDNWEKFNGAQTDPGDSTDYVIPTNLASSAAAMGPGSLADHFGLPPGQDYPAGIVSCLPFRAYQLIWNTWFRDENLQDSVNFTTGDGGVSIQPGTSNGTLRRRGKRHDYFTSCLPFPQKGDEVTLPLGSTAPLVATSAPLFESTSISSFVMQIQPGGSPADLRSDTSGPVSAETALWNDPGLHVDLTAATAASINSIREAFQVQRLLERDARGGTRYTEIVKSHFGVTSPDARLQRPEYLGGGTTPVMVSPIAQTSSTDGTSPQANLAAIGTASVSGHGFVKSFTEHCILIGLVNVRADLTYQQGINRMWSRRTRFDFYWPALAHLGEQAVLNKELWYQGGVAADEDVFGYQERYAEYRYKPSEIVGSFRSDYAFGTLDIWHLSQDFGSLPTLSESFIVDNPPIDRIVAVPTEPDFLCDVYFQLTCARPMPVYGVPGLVDHF